MKRPLLSWLLVPAAAAAVVCLAPDARAADVGVRIDIGQPGFYGRIDIGRFPRPPVVYAQPVIVAPPPVTVVRQPIYLRVPPGHARDWRRHCARYAACGQQTYFVDDHWYRTVYAPQVVHVHHHHAKPHGPHWRDRDDRRDHRHRRGGRNTRDD